MKDKNTNFHIHSFMRRLGLSDREILVYAFLYSFTVGEGGYYWGGQKYMADVLGFSMRTLQRVLHKLYERGLVEKHKDGRSRQGIRCKKPSADINNNTANTYAYEQYDGRYSDTDGKIIEWNENSVAKMRENESEFYKAATPKHTLISYGREGLVLLTKSQYDTLCMLLPREQVQTYFLRYELMLKDNMKTGAKAPHSAYKTIAKWINEDTKI